MTRKLGDFLSASLILLGFYILSVILNFTGLINKIGLISGFVGAICLIIVESCYLWESRR